MDTTSKIKLATRFMMKVSIPCISGHVVKSPCWEWVGSKQKKGYGLFKQGKHGGTTLAHRISYEIFSGVKVPDNLTIDHLCRNRECVNPAHLEVVTLQENQARRVLVTHCPRGHEYTDDNTYVYTRKNRIHKTTNKNLQDKTCKKCELLRKKQNDNR